MDEMIKKSDTDEIISKAARDFTFTFAEVMKTACRKHHAGSRRSTV